MQSFLFLKSKHIASPWTWCVMIKISLYGRNWIKSAIASFHFMFRKWPILPVDLYFGLYGSREICSKIVTLILLGSCCYAFWVWCADTTPCTVQCVLLINHSYLHLSYCFLFWGISTHANLQKLFVLENKFVHALNAPYYSRALELFLLANKIQMPYLYHYLLI